MYVSDAVGTVTGPPGRVEDGWLLRPLRLADEVTVMLGANDEPMLFDSRTGGYVRVNPGGLTVLRALDGTRTGAGLLRAAARCPGPDGPRDRSPAVRAFLSDLRAAGVLNVPAGPSAHRTRIPRMLLGRGSPRLRLPASRLHAALRVPAAVLAHRPRAALSGAGLLAMVAAGLVVAALVRAAPFGTGVRRLTGPTDRPWALLVVVLLGQIVAHESGHALVCQALGVPVREVGVKLWCLIFPVPYVDRTDAYRVRTRSGRVAIALAGPLVDLVFAGLSAAVALAGTAAPAGGATAATGDTTAATARYLLVFQVIVLLTNLNPLLPTDGHKAIEAAIGELNIRYRAHAYLAYRLLRIPLPTAYRALSAARRRVYLAFAVLSGVYLVLLLATVGYYAFHLAGLAPPTR